MLFYLHVPKTGGQTLARRLASAFLPEETHCLKQELVYPKDVETLHSLGQTKKFVESHVAGPLLKDARDVDVLTTVRQPVDQMISNWRHMRREPNLIWHRAAKKLRPGEFFDNFGDFFLDHQTGYLISAFVGGMRTLAQESGHYFAAMRHLSEVINRIRWLVPTESIDEFVGLWEIDSRRTVANKSESINVAEEDEAEVAEARAALLARPHLYAADQILFQIARERFARYREDIHSAITPWRSPANSSRAYSSDSSGVWLLQNWHYPEQIAGRREWWFGPTNTGCIRIRRANGQKKLSFVVSVVNGISVANIDIKVREKGLRPPVEILANGPEGSRVSVDLSSAESEVDLTVTVPNCFASIMTTKSDDSLVRRAFLASDFKLN